MNVQSIKDRLRNEANAANKTVQQMQTYYGLERTIYRISISKYANHFVLKGGIFLYALFDKNYLRATTDIDLLARRISNSDVEMKKVFEDIFSQDVDDGLTFDLNSLSVTNITEFKDYHGLNVKIFAYLDRTQIPISIDIGYGDVVYPDSIEIEFPTILDNEAPKIQAYSIETAIAEKLEAIVSNGFDNSRYKDFYDIYILGNNYSINSELLRDAIVETFKNRNTELSIDTDAFSPDFYNSPVHITRWNSFVKKKKTEVDVSLEDTIKYIKDLILPLISKQ